jgi:hypothetical protein
MSEDIGDILGKARGEFEAVMASAIFDRAPNLGILLRYVCGKYLEGKADEVKEYNIAVEAFGRPADFDKRRDSIVRVEAHRLRKRLQQYYEQEDGARHELRIEIPSGSYVPVFVRNTPKVEAAVESWPAPAPVEMPARRVAAPRPRWRLVWLGVTAIAMASVAAAVYFPRHGEARAGKAAPPAATASVSTLHPAAVSGDAVRIMAGSTVRSYTDTFGAAWSGDRYFTGGTARTVPFRAIARTKDATIFLKYREGDFQYDIPLKPGVYEMRLFFAETNYGEGNVDGGGETSRLAEIVVNGRPVLEYFDVISDAAGYNTADVKVFKDIEPAADGLLHLGFVSRKAFAFVNAIEIVPGERGRLRPIRMLARESGYTDTQGRVWVPESYAAGGRIVVRQQEVAQTPDPGIYQSERYGNFSYAIPVAPASYTVVLHFAESWHGPGRPDGGGAGSRLFDVYCNRAPLLRDFDIFAEAKGGYRALERRFTGLKPNAQGKLELAFVPTRNYACVNAIEVLDEGR